MASTSPRRRELVKALNIDVECIGSGVEESPPRAHESPTDYVRRLSFEKAKQVSIRSPGELVLGADTSVVIDGDILGKPVDEMEAYSMLRRLRGRKHLIISGVTLIDGGTGRSVSADKCSKIELRHYSDEEIARYVASGEPMDKAGAYAVQDETFRPANSLRGCYLNAIGFPLCQVIKLLDSLGIHVGIRPEWKFPSMFEGCSIIRAQEAARR